MKKLNYRIVKSVGSTTFFYLQIKKTFLWVFSYWEDYYEYDGFTYPRVTFNSEQSAKVFAEKKESELNRVETILPKIK